MVLSWTCLETSDLSQIISCCMRSVSPGGRIRPDGCVKGEEKARPGLGLAALIYFFRVVRVDLIPVTADPLAGKSFQDFLRSIEPGERPNSLETTSHLD